MIRRLAANRGTVLAAAGPLAIIPLFYVVIVRPRAAEGRQAAAQAIDLRARLGALATGTIPIDDAVGRGPRRPSPALQEFEQRVPDADRVPDLVERLARIAAEGAGDVAALRIETGGRADAGGNDASVVDPRLELFGAPLASTPIAVGFEATYSGVGRFLWRLRNLPTAVEIRTLEVTRSNAVGRPRVELGLVALQRTGPAGMARPAANGARTSARKDAVLAFEDLARAAPRVDLGVPPQWRRDPFRADAIAASQVAAAPKAPDPVLGAILSSADRRMALLNGRIVGVGDRVGPFTVIEIANEQVVVRGPDGDTRTLPVRSPNATGGVRR